MPDRQIARLLNRVGKPTGQGNSWTEARVRSFRSYSDIAVHRQDEWVERGDVTLEAAAESLGVAKMTVLRMIRRGEIKGRQPCKGAPWVIKADDLAVLGAGRSKGSITPNSAQHILQFQ
jgi:excisionase family DNA binding protein